MRRMNRSDPSLSAETRYWVSAIIPVYDGARYLGEAIESVRAQTHRPIQVIVVDDGSSDESARVAQQFGDAVQYIFQEHRGASAARNRGVEFARGQFLAFLDADDVWLKEKIERQLQAFDADPALDMVFGYVQEFHSPELDERVKSKTIAKPDLQPGYVTGTMLIRRESFLRVGMFDTGLVLSEFMDWYLRARELGLHESIVPQLLLRRRIHESNTGIRLRDARNQYATVLKAALERRRAGTRTKPRSS
jgi:glycosyltransferase involved in cell wall biosynthesis